MLRRAMVLADRLTQLRHDVHRHPELGFEEHRTAALVADTLRSLGIRVETGVGRTGVVGHLGSDGPVVALRADMDALPIQEANAVPYASEVPGVMHACGHDAHTACLLGAAMLLVENPPPGRVRFLFQPSEEGPDAERKTGAVRMIDDGAMTGVDAVFAIHVDTEADTGTVRARPGPAEASSDRFYVAIQGVAAHGATPQVGVDAILLASMFVRALHTILSRRIAASDAGVITIGTIRGGTKENIIPDRVDLGGTIRSLDPVVREKLIAEIEGCCGVVRPMGGDFEFTLVRGNPPVVNDRELTRFALGVLGEALGADRVGEREVQMGSEDFAKLAQLAPGVFLSLGARAPGSPTVRAHTPTFDVDDACLPIGAAVYAELATRYLARSRAGEAARRESSAGGLGLPWRGTSPISDGGRN